jgi:hypothetical protein
MDQELASAVERQKPQPRTSHASLKSDLLGITNGMVRREDRHDVIESQTVDTRLF